jgi:protein O-GlcNAc transferase
MPPAPQPDIDTLFQSGLALHQQGQLDAAEAIYRQVLGRDGNHVSAWQLRGVIRYQQKLPAEALPLLERAVALDPANAASLNNLGNVLIDLHRFEDAVDALRRATALRPEAADMRANLGRALRFYKKLDEAAEAYRHAIALDHKRAAYHASLGNVLSASKDDAGALTAFAAALDLAPNQPNLLHNVALSLVKLKRFEEAIAHSKRAVALQPKEPEYRVTLGAALQYVGRLDEAIEEMRLARNLGAVGSRYQNSLLFHMNNAFEHDPAEARNDAIAFIQRLAGHVRPYTEWFNDTDTERPLRIGLVSGDFTSHPVGRFLLGPLAELDQSLYEIYAYSQLRAPQDPLQQQFRQMIKNWRDIQGMSDDVVARDIRADKIDILVDLAGHTAHNRLSMFTYKPAPVAFTWLGYFASTGVAAIDYVLCNRWLLPESELSHFVEEPWYLPDTHWCFSRPAQDVEVAPLPAGDTGTITFGSFNNFHKLSPATIALWARVIRDVPNSRLHLRYNVEQPVVDRLTAALLAAGAPADRIEVVGKNLPYAEHLATYGGLDIALDPFPYNGGTTTAEALYMGVPVLTLRGDRFSAHMAESTVRAAGLDDWVALTADEYVAKAAAFALDRAGLAALRAGLRDRVLASKLFDAKLFARDLEDAFRGMWRTYCDKVSAPKPERLAQP